MKKILLIDDDPDILESLSTVFQSHGYEIVTAANGTEGYKIAVKEKPDLIILDVMMDSSDEGFKTSYSIRKNEEIRYTPILMLTSVNTKTNFSFDPKIDGQYLPVDDFVEKPAEPALLLEKTSTLLNLGKDKINISGKP
ncbi:MAG: response regulator [Spirochaetales bacterium]|nr:response regulator [Spirochaetales bacterium]